MVLRHTGLGTWEIVQLQHEQTPDFIVT